MSDPGQPKPNGDMDKPTPGGPAKPAATTPGSGAAGSGPAGSASGGGSGGGGPSAGGTRPGAGTGPGAARPAGARPPVRPGEQVPRTGPSGTPPPARPRPVVDDDDYDDDEYDDGPASQLPSLLATLGVGLVAVITTQVIAAILQGLSAPSDQLDVFHRLGFPFANMGALTELFLVVALGLMSLPIMLGEAPGRTQDRLVGGALTAVIVLALITALGSLLAVRYQLYQLSLQGTEVPNYARLGFAVFLLGALGTAAVAVFGAIAAMRARKAAAAG